MRHTFLLSLSLFLLGTSASPVHDIERRSASEIAADIIGLAGLAIKRDAYPGNAPSPAASSSSSASSTQPPVPQLPTPSPPTNTTIPTAPQLPAGVNGTSNGTSSAAPSPSGTLALYPYATVPPALNNTGIAATNGTNGTGIATPNGFNGTGIAATNGTNSTGNATAVLTRRTPVMRIRLDVGDL